MSHEIEAYIDQVGALDVEIKSLQKKRKAIVESLAGLEHGKHAGLSYVATIVVKCDWRLDTKAVKVEMGDAWYLKRSKIVDSRAVRTSLI